MQREYRDLDKFVFSKNINKFFPPLINLRILKSLNILPILNDSTNGIEDIKSMKLYLINSSLLVDLYKRKKNSYKKMKQIRVSKYKIIVFIFFVYVNKVLVQISRIIIQVKNKTILSIRELILNLVLPQKLQPL